MKRLDPLSLAKAQLARDRAAVREPLLFARKVARMKASSFGFLRGTAPMFYEILAARPTLAGGPRGEGWLAGDLHLENFGVYRCGAPHEAGHGDVTFDVNDFDDAIHGSHRIDVLRLLTSTLLAARDAGADGGRALECADALMGGYVHGMHEKTAPDVPAPVARLLARARERSRGHLLASRTTGVGDERRFVRSGDRYHDVAPRLAWRASDVFVEWARGIARARALDPKTLEPLDVAFRVAGTGSLGVQRLAILVRGKGGRDGAWIFELKEQGTPSGATLLGVPRVGPADRVVIAMRACQARPPQLLGAVQLEGRSMLVRRLTPQEDKLSLADIARAEVLPVAAYLGSLAAHAHQRGASKPSKRPWKKRERAALIEQAIELAGIHEAAYLAYCRLVASPK
jgi:uncharacterized protein (DUF2252 family)